MRFRFLQHRSSALLLAGAAVGIVIGVLMTVAINTHLKTSENKSSDTKSLEQTASPKILYWYDPMQPTQHFDKPGKSPFMDMELVPRYADGEIQTNNRVTIDAAQSQNLGLRRAKVARIALQTELEVSGKLRFNERDLAIVQLRASGFVEKVWPLAVGDSVSAGQPIAEFLIPEWFTPQNELLALSATNNPNLLKAARARLILLGMSDASIAQVEKNHEPQTRVTIRAPIGGVIETLEVKTGMTFASGQTLARINGLSSLWLDAAIPEAKADQLRAGDSAIFFPSGVNTSHINGRLEYLLPSVNETTRTLTARIVLPNLLGELKPGTTGRLVLRNIREGYGLAVPTEAVIRTGKRVLVMLAESGGHFRPVEVTPGHEVGNQTLITTGLSEGQEIVASGQFLVDSEASLLGIGAEMNVKTDTQKINGQKEMHP
jgi:membrane fusion protein, copper/silver efflux system